MISLVADRILPGLGRIAEGVGLTLAKEVWSEVTRFLWASYAPGLVLTPMATRGGSKEVWFIQFTVAGATVLSESLAVRT